MFALFLITLTLGAEVPWDWTRGLNSGGATDDVQLTIASGDTVTFSWTGTHSVKQVDSATKIDGTCDFTGATELQAAGAGPYTTAAMTEGTYYYGCGVGSHCTSGQKLTLTVLAAPTPSGCPATQMAAGMTGGASGGCLAGDIIQASADSCTTTCDAGYTGTDGTISCDDGTTTSTGSCTEVMCDAYTFPTGTVAGDANPCTSDVALSSIPGSNTCDLKCDTDWDGAGTTLTCTQNGAAGDLSGQAVCAAPCTLPATATAGYTYTEGAVIPMCHAGSCASPDLAGVTCDVSGTPAVTVCTDGDTVSTLSGCDAAAAADCRLPVADQLGYTFNTNGVIANCKSDSCSQPDLSVVQCASGYSGTSIGIVAICTNDDVAVVLTGCTEASAVDCTMPSDSVNGYTFTTDAVIPNCNANGCGDPAGCCGSPDMSGASCTTPDFIGTPTTSGCTSDVSAVTLMGCNAAVWCTTPSTLVDGYTFTADQLIPDCNNGICTDPDMSGVSCSDGYTGTPSTLGCPTAGSFMGVPEVILTGCENGHVCTTEDNDQCLKDQSGVSAATCAMGFSTQPAACDSDTPLAHCCCASCAPTTTTTTTTESPTTTDDSTTANPTTTEADSMAAKFCTIVAVVAGLALF